MKTSLWAVLALVVCLLAGCASGPAVQTATFDGVLPPPGGATATGEGEDEGAYRLGAHDLLHVSVFGVPDLSRDVRISPTGEISLPLAGNVVAAGKTVPELQTAIAARLAESYLQHPQVSVFVKEYASQRITLQGALNNPGIYPVMGKTSLLQAVAMAGGLAPLAEADGVVVFREVDGKRMAAVFDLSKISTGHATDPRVYGDDIIVVAKSGSRDALHELIKSAPLLTLFFLVL